MKIALIFIVVALIVVVIVVSLLPSERTHTQSEVISADVQKVFEIVTNLDQQNWRSDVGELTILDSTLGSEVWVETPKQGPKIKFRTKVKNAPELFVIEIIDNEGFGGMWTGKFSAIEAGRTKIEFTEQVSMNGFMPKLMSYLFFDIKKNVQRYIADLKQVAEKKL